MLKNKIVVRKIRNIVILLMAIIIMFGAYKNIDRSRAEDVTTVDAIAIDNYGYLEDEEFILEAKEIENDLYEIEIPESVNGKKINQIIKATLKDIEGEALEIIENKIELTKEQIEKQIINLEVTYDMAILEKNQEGLYEKILLSEKSEEERQQLEANGTINTTSEITTGAVEEIKTLYNKILRYEDEKNGKLVELKGYLPKEAQLKVEEVSEEQLKEIFGDKKVSVAYDIKIIAEVVTEIPADEANPDDKAEEIIETIELNPEEFGEKCEVLIKDVNIEENSEVYHVREDNTIEQVNVKDNTEENISFEAQTFSIYAVTTTAEIEEEDGTSTGESEENTSDGNTTSGSITSGGIEPDEGTLTGATSLGFSASGTYYIGQSVSVSVSGDGQLAMVGLSTSPGQASTAWPGTYYGVTFTRTGTYYLSARTSDGVTGTGGPYTVIEKSYTGGSGGSGNNSSTQSSTDTVAPVISLQGVTAGGGESTSSTTNITVADYGGTVTNYTPTNGTDVGWQIFHTDGTNVYLIADDYVPNSYAPKGKGGTAPSKHSNGYGIYFPKTMLSQYTGMADIPSAIKNKWFTVYTDNSTQYNAQHTAYFMDTSVWGTFKDSTFAEYAIGGPPIEMFFESYNAYRQANGSSSYEKKLTAGTYGYILSGGYTSAAGYSEYSLGTNFYTITSRTNGYGYWVPSPKFMNSSSDVSYSFWAGHNLQDGVWTGRKVDVGYANHNQYGSTATWWTALNFRPVVCLKSGVQVQKQSDGTYLLVTGDDMEDSVDASIISDTTWKQTHEVTIKIEDTGSGLASGMSIQYAWSTSNTTTPTSWTNLTIPSYTAGAKSVETSITKTGITGKYYLWIKPVTVKDVAGNKTTSVITTGQFWFDNTAAYMRPQAYNVSLLRFYEADNNAGTGFTAGLTTWKDLAGNQDATVKGPTSFTKTSAPVEYYLSLDGVDDYVNLGTVSLSKFTLEATVMFDAVPTATTTILSNTQYGGTTIQITSDGYPTFNVYNSSTSSYVKATSNTKITAGTKYHIAGTFNGSTLILYVNGTSAATATFSGSYGAPTDDTVMMVGAEPVGSEAVNYFAKMKVYSVRIYSNALSSSWIGRNKLASIDEKEWTQSHTVYTTIGDSHSGLATGASIQAAWNTSRTSAPSFSNASTISSYSSGASYATVRATGSGLTGEYYLWLKPATLKDVAGNSTTSNAVSLVKTYFDNTAPVTSSMVMEYVYGDWSRYTQGTWTNKNVFAGYEQGNPGPRGATDAHSGVAKYQISTDNSTWIDYSYDHTNSLYYFDTEGTHTRYFRAVDNAGNASASISRTAQIDKTKPTITASNKSVNTTNKNMTIDLTATDALSGVRDFTITANDITVYVDGVQVDTIRKTLTPNGTNKYTLTLSDFEEIVRQEGKSYKEWSGTVTIKITAGLVTDVAGNTSAEQELDLGHVDVIDPEFEYEFSETDINQQDKTVKIVFTATDKFFSESALTIDDLTIKVDSDDITNVASVTKTLTSEAITETRNGSTVTIGYTYTLLLSELEQDAIASGKKYLDYSGVVTVLIPAGQILDTSDNGNNVQTIVLGLDITPTDPSNVELPSTEYTTPYLPDGYSYLEGNLSTGLVIADSSGNEYVWVEVPRTTTVYSTAGLNITEFSETEYTRIENDLHTYTTVYRNGTTATDTWSSEDATGLTETEYNNQKKKMLKSIYKNGGFYVGRYETGIDYDDPNSYRIAAGNTTQTAVIQQNAYPYNWVSTAQAQELSESFATTEYTSSLMFGVQWDLMMKYLETKGTAQADLNTDSTSWGNTLVIGIDITSTVAKYSTDLGQTWSSTPYNKPSGTRILLTTGAHDTFYKQNISDLAGNVHELTLEYSAVPVTRGAYTYSKSGRVASASARQDFTNYNVGGNDGGGFRVALYKDEGISSDSPDSKPTYIPAGYTHVVGTSMETGYVIKDTAGNEYVWIEVPRTSTVYPTAGVNITSFTEAEYTRIENDLHTYTSAYRSDTWGNDEYYSDETTGLTEIEYNVQKKKMLKSIYKNGGFYVGRYETGIADSYRTEAGNTTQTAVIQQNAYPYNFVTTAQAQELSEGFATTGYTSSLMYGVQWDLVLKYLESKGTTQAELITDSTRLGNYKDNLYTIENTDSKYWTSATGWKNEPYGTKTASTSVLLSTGASNSFTRQNIFDFAGNVCEFTLSYSGIVSGPCVVRGGYYSASGTLRQAYKDTNCDPNYAPENIGFRVSLYKDEGVGPSGAVIADVVDPIWTVHDVTIDDTNKNVKVELLATDKYFNSAGLTAEDITINVDGVNITNITKTLSEPTILKEDRDGDGTAETQYGVKYTLTLTNWEEAARQIGKFYKEWSGTTQITISEGTATDLYGNSSKEKTLSLGHVDIIKPEFEYEYSESDIDKTQKTVKMVFSVTDKYYDNEDTTNILELSDLTIKVDSEDITNVTSVTKTFTKEAITETRDGSTVTVGYIYTLLLSELEQDTIASGKKYLDYSGVVTVTIPAGQILDTSDNGNNAQTIVLGIDISPTISIKTELPSTDYTTPYLPEGYSYVEGDLNEGLVIADGFGNEFVWVEVPKTTTVYSTAGLNITEFSDTDYTNIENDLQTYTTAYRNGTGYTDTWSSEAATGLTETEYNTQKKKMLKSIYKNGGFYAGRYETGIGCNDANSYRTAAGDTIQTPVIQQNAYPYNWVTNAQAQELSQSFGTTGYTSSLMFGVQWDLIMKYLETKGTTQDEIITDSTNWGNYKYNLWNITNTSAKYSTDGGNTYISVPYAKESEEEVVLTTGADASFSKMEIYDLAGNMSEWTLESFYDEQCPGVIRGGNFTMNFATYQNPGVKPPGSLTMTSSLNTGFRVALYKDEGILSDSTESEPTYIPDGYTHVAGTTMENGYVIKDGTGNEYVWIEVPRTTEIYPTAGINITSFTDAECTRIENDIKTYTADYNNYDEFVSEEITGLTETEYNTLKKKMLMSIYKNEGFYVGRYETGIADSYRTEEGDATQTPVIKQNAYPYNYVTASQAQELSESFATSGYTSSLMFDMQWNLILKYLESKGVTCGLSQSEIATMGNYWYSTYNITDENVSYNELDQDTWEPTTWENAPYNKISDGATLLTTGAISEFKQQNIYDIAGNMFEYTIGMSNYDSSSIARGGDAGFYESDIAYGPGFADLFCFDYSYFYIGFRVALFKDEEVIADVVDPIWTVQNQNTDQINKQVTIDLIATDKYFNNTTLTADNIAINIDGVNVTNITKILSNPTILTEDRDGDGTAETQYGVKYTLTLTDWEEIVRQTGKKYKEWSGTTQITIPAGTITDQNGNSSKEKTFSLGHVDVIKPEFEYEYSEADIDQTQKTVKMVFSVTDKYYDYEDTNNVLELDDLTIKIDSDDITNVTSVTKTFTKEAITETRNDSTVTVGYTYTLLLSELEQDAIATGKNYLDYSGVVTIEVPEIKISDTSDNTNNAQSIVLGIDITPSDPSNVKLPSTEYTTPYLPDGYSYLEGNLNRGLVIADSLGNEYVWVEVPKTAEVYQTAGLDVKTFTQAEYDAIEADLQAYTAVYRESADWVDEYYSDEATGLTESQYNTQKKKMLKSIYKNGGFYVGRYETGVEDSYKSETGISGQVPVIKQNAYVYNKLSTSQAQTLSSGFASEGYISSLMFDVQWDLIMKYLETKGTTQSELTEDSSLWGNYGFSSYTITNPNAKYWNRTSYADAPFTKSAGTNTILTTGASEAFKRQNIYDLAGNVDEMTLALLKDEEYPNVLRGWSYYDYGSSYNQVASGHRGWPIGVKDEDNGFRVALYKDEGISADSADTKPTYIPAGYTHVAGTTMETGYVVEDSSGNQYVWVEVPRTTTVYPTAGINVTEFSDTDFTNIENDLHTYTTVYRNGTSYTDTWSSEDATGLTETEYNTQKKKMLKSIYKNGGFYVGRYETGIDYDDPNSYRTATGDTIQTPVIQQNAYPYYYVTTAQAQELSESFATTGYTSSLMFGVQWDLILKYLETKGTLQSELTSYGVSWGNGNDNLYNIKNTGAKYSLDEGATWLNCPYEKTSASSVLLTTGSSDIFSKQGISDLAGNVSEITLETFTSVSNSIIIRSSDYIYRGSSPSYPPNYRTFNISTANNENGFRVALYRDDGISAESEGTVADVVDPLWTTTDVDLDATGGSSGIKLQATDKYFSTSTLTEDNITIYIGGVERTDVGLILGTPTPLTEDRNGDGIADSQYGVEYPITFELDDDTGYTSFTDINTGAQSKYKESIGEIEIKIAEGTITDLYGNTSNEQTFELANLDTSNPEVIFNTADTTIDPINNTITVVFDITDKFFSTSTLEASHITAKIGETTIEIDSEALTSVDLTATVDGENRVVGKRYTLVLSPGEQTGIVTIDIPAEKATDSTGKTNNAQTITIGINLPEGTGSAETIDLINPTVTANPEQTTNVDGNDFVKTQSVTITLEDDYSGVSTSSSKQYYLSTSDTTLSGGSWTDYTSETPFTIGTNLTGTYYLFVKTITDNDGNISTSNGTMTTVTDPDTNTEITCHKFGTYKFDNEVPTITVDNTSCSWKNSAYNVTITTEETGGSGLLSTNSYQYYLSTESDSLAGGTWTDYTSGTAISLNPGVSGDYYLFVKQIQDGAGNASTSNGTDATVTNPDTGSDIICHKYGTYYFDYDLPEWNYVSKDIYLTNPDDVGNAVENNDKYANAERTVVITFEGSDITSNITSTLTSDAIVVTVNEEPVANTNKHLDISGGDGTTKGATGTLTITGITGDGILNVELPSGTLKDEATNTNVDTNITTDVDITIDNISPELTLDVTSPVEGYYKADQVITITATYNENIYKEETSNTLITTTADAPTMTLEFGGALSKNTVTCTAISGNVITYTYTIKGPTTLTGTDGDNGTMTISLASVYDAAGNEISAENITPSVNIVADTIAPTVTSITADKETWTNAENITYTVVFSEAVTGFTASDVIVNSGQADLEVTSVTGSGTIWTVVVSTTDDVEYNESITIKANGSTIDIAGNKIPVAETSEEIGVDRIDPTLTIEADKTSPTNAESITYTIVFSENVTGFEAEDITVNSGKGTVTSFSGSGTTYTAVISTTDNEEYTETITIAEGKCIDKAGNGNVSATSAEILVDRIEPTWTYVSKDIYLTNPNDVGNTAENNDIYANADRTVVIVFKGTDTNGHNVTSTLTSDAIEVTVNGTPVANTNKTLTTSPNTGTDQEVTCTLTITGITGDGILNVELPSGTLTDQATNTNVDTNITTNVDITIDNTNPNLDFAVTSPASGTYKAGQVITITATYNEDIYKEVTSNTLIDTTSEAPAMTLAFGDKEAEGTVTCTAVNGRVLTYSYTIQGDTPVTGTNGDNGVLKITSLESVYDAAGNEISASNVIPSPQITADTILPTVTITADKTSMTNSENITYTFTFSENVTGFTADDITVANGTKGTFTAVSGTVYTLVVSTIDDTFYTETVTVPADGCVDIAGNGNVESAPFEIQVDRVDPTITATPDKTTNTTANDYQKSQSVTITVDDVGSGLLASNTYEYYLSNSSTALSGDTGWHEYTSGTPFTIGTGLTGDYYLFVKTVEDSVTDTNKNISNTLGTMKTIDGTTYHMFGTYKFDNTNPYWEVGTPSIDYTNKKVTVEITGTDDHSGYKTDTLDNTDFEVWVDGTKVTNVTKQLNTATYYKADGSTTTSQSEAVKVKYTLTLSTFAETARQSLKSFKEWSGTTDIVIIANTIEDNLGNKNTLQDKTTDPEFLLGHVDVLNPEFTYESSKTTIVGGNTETVTILFDVTDKFFASTTLSSLDASQITVAVDDYDVTGLNTYLNSNSRKVLTKVKDVYYDTTAGTTYVDSGATGTGTKVGERYQLVISGLDQGDAYKYSGYMTLSFAEGTIKDTSNNTSTAMSITIGKDDVDGNPGQDTSGNGIVVDVVDPIWELGDVTLDAGTIKLITKDKYFNASTIDEDDITVYVNGVASSTVVKDITSVTPTEIKETVNGVANTVVGKEYTLQLSNIVPSGGGYTSFEPTNKSDLVEGPDGFKYKSENGGSISLKIAAGVTTDKSGNANNETTLDVGTIDITQPEVYEVQKIQDSAANTETIIFNITDRNYDPSKIVALNEITLWIDDVQLDSLRNGATLTYKEIKFDIDNVEDKVLGHQYTLVIPNIAESTKQDGKDYLEYSGTLKITIAQNAAKDLKGNTLNTDTTTITDFIDYLKPQIEQVTVSNPINTSAKTYTMSFNVIDKYLDITNLIGIDTDSNGTIDNLNNELIIKVDGETASDITWQLTYTPITATMNKTVGGTVANNTYTIGHTYTLVLSQFEQESKQGTKDFFEWSGTVTVEIAANAVNDKNGITNTVINYSDAKTLNGEHVDFIKPVLEEVTSTRGTNTETILFNIMDKYLVVTDSDSDGNAHETIAPSEITVYVDGEAVTVDYTNSSSTGLNGVLTWVQDFTHTVNGDSTHIVGQQYQLVLSGFEQVSRNAKDYKDYSGTVTMEIAQTAVADTKGNTLDATVAKRTVTGDFVDFIKPQLEYTHSSSDINHGTKTYTMTFDVTDKYYNDVAANVLTLDDLTITMDSEYSGVSDFDLKALANQGKVNISLSDAEKTATFNKTVGGVVETTATSHMIGHTYTLTISNLDQLEIADGDKTVNYSGIITVVVAQNQLSDTGPAGNGTNPNKNVETQMVSGVNVPGGSGSGVVVDVVSPLFDKVSSSAYAFNPSNKSSSIGTITFKATDRYFVEGSGITADDIQVVVDGSVVSSGITKRITDTEELTEDRIINGTPQDDVQYGVKYTLEITGWAQNAHQVKIRIPAEKLTDQYGNKNIETDLIVYNCLELTSSEVASNSGFLGNTNIERQEVHNVTFLSNVSGAPKDAEGNIDIDNDECWDVSARNDKSIIAWRTASVPYTVYIGSKDEIFANQNSTYLFGYIGYGSSSTATETISNISSLNVRSVTNMTSMFEGCGVDAMTTFTLGSNFNTSNVTKMGSMFKNFGKTQLASLSLGTQFFTNEVTDMSSMFEECGTNAMTSLILGSNFNTLKVTTMDSMFKNCTPKITSIDLGTQFDTSIVTDMGSMFEGFGSTSLTSLDLGNSFYTYKVTVTDMNNMFNGCGTTAMTVLDLGPAFTKISTNHTDFMKDCGKSTLVIYAPESIYLDRTTLKTN